MNNILKNQVCNLQAGTVVKGKWHQLEYRIIKKLGAGATGVVYLVEQQGYSFAALKFSFNNMSVTAEVNVLKHFSKVHGKVLGPSLLDVDDWQDRSHGSTISFYVMEYVKGEPFLSFIQKRGYEWIGILNVQLLNDLNELHKAGWVFGDLKPENLIVAHNPIKIRWLDVGGTTLHGRSIKEFTDFYDRAHWGMGSRKAEPSYDLFSVAMIMIHAACTKRFKKGEKPLEQLKHIIKSHKSLIPFQDVLNGAITGKYNSAEEMKQDLLNTLNGTNNHNYQTTNIKNKSKKIKQSTRSTTKVKKKKRHVLETFILFTSMMIIYLLYLFIQVL